MTIDVRDVQRLILDSAEFQKFAQVTTGMTADWFDTHRAGLGTIDADTRPNLLIATIGDDLLARFKPVPLLDEYDIYEQLMTYWHDIMHDDVFLVMNDGWLEAAKPRKTIEDKERKLSETPDLVVGSGRSATKYKMDLIPPALIVGRYFVADQARVDELNAIAEAATRTLDEYLEEHAVEDGLLAGALEDDRISKALVAARLRVAKREMTDPDEIKALQHALNCYDAEAAAKKAVKEAEGELALATLKKYADLTEADVKSLVLDAKWAGTIRNRVVGEVNALTFNLVSRIQELGERYAETVGELDAELKTLQAKVSGHLSAMGVR